MLLLCSCEYQMIRLFNAVSSNKIKRRSRFDRKIDFRLAEKLCCSFFLLTVSLCLCVCVFFDVLSVYFPKTPHKCYNMNNIIKYIVIVPYVYIYTQLYFNTIFLQYIHICMYIIQKDLVYVRIYTIYQYSFYTMRIAALLLFITSSLTISANRRVAQPCTSGCEKFLCGTKACSQCLPAADSRKLATEICYNTPPSPRVKCSKNRDCKDWQMCTTRGSCIDIMKAEHSKCKAFKRV